MESAVGGQQASDTTRTRANASGGGGGGLDKDFISRKVIKPRYVVPEFLWGKKYETVMSILNGCGLMPFSRTRAEQIHEDLIRRIISVPCDWFGYDGSSNTARPAEWYPFTDDAAFKLIGHRKLTRAKGGGWRIKGISPEMRYLLYFVTHVLAPWTSNHAKFLGQDTRLMFLLLSKHKVNWAFFVSRHMRKCREGTRGLPYAFVVQAILKHFGVDTSNEQAHDEHVFWKIGTHTFRDEQKQMQHEDDDDRVSGDNSYMHPPITIQATPTSEYGGQLIQLKDYVQENVVPEIGQIANQQQQLRWCLDQSYAHLQYQGRQLDYICRHLGIHVPPPTDIPNYSHDDSPSTPEPSQ
ncbi:hypothetical protein PIB30_066442 [Stylosanthes scabra]|uniref:Uncharacterized protein n=1 Tax=Stylosanthes scabra TaxID=79078 RepID=A0ABU6YL73_9FABA|nr:hypothetical protein [Stylosanthes scabra]